MSEQPLPKETSFETALARLEEIVDKLESGKLTLEESMACFEEGARLQKFCSEKLAAAEKKIELLVQKADGALAWEKQP